jgi:transposase
LSAIDAKGGDAPIAGAAPERIAALYAVEKTIRGRSAEERRAVRQGRSKPLVAALKAWLEHQLGRVSAKAPIAEEIGYGLNHWDGLTRFLDDGRIELDTNIVERGIHCSPAMTKARRAGPVSPRSSKPAN